jgi:hypothetical protein
MIEDDLLRDDISATLSEEILTTFGSKNFFQEGVFVQDILSKFLELKREVMNLKREVSENRLLIDQLEKKRSSYGREVVKRVSYMLSLINDYGGIMTSKDTRKIMGLSKDEFYRTLQCAKDEDLIETLPYCKDRRSYMIKLKPK